MKSKLGNKQRIEHILDACNKVLLATENYDEEKFVNNFIITAAAYSFQIIIGEASIYIAKDFKNRHPEFDWDLMRGMRNIIVDEYFGVDNHKVWDTVTNDIPKLKTDCENALNEFE